MPINRLFGGTIDTTAKALDVLMERQGLIQSNIANIETPGYKAQDLNFSGVMESIKTGRGELARTHPGHLAVNPVTVAESLEFSSEDRPVDLDDEMMKLSENQLMYQISTRIITKKLEGLSAAIDEGSK